VEIIINFLAGDS